MPSSVCKRRQRRPATQQFFVPVAGGGYQATGQADSENGQASIGTEQSSGPTTVAVYTFFEYTVYQSGPTVPEVVKRWSDEFCSHLAGCSI